ncbi:MAG: hypothetical protein K6A80_08125 [Saccharofermentans sp.]|nr:hypothetical protein [Saccharofermentans sp.]
MKDRYFAVLIILLIILFSVIGLSLMAKKIAVTGADARESQAVQERYNKFLENDVTLYWIGDYPEELGIISEKVVLCEGATRDNMPLKSPEFHTIRKDETGNVIEERVPVTYAEHLYIVINGKVLTDEEYAVIRECFMDNGVKTVIMGQDAIQSFRDFLILPKQKFAEGEMMAYSLPAGSARFGDGSENGDSSLTLINYLIDDIAAENTEENTEENNDGN